MADGSAPTCLLETEQPQDDIFKACFMGNLARVKQILDEAPDKAVLLKLKNLSGSFIFHHGTEYPRHL